MILLTGAACVVLTSCGQTDNSTGQEEEKSTPVQVECVIKGSLTLNNDIYGVASPNAEVNIGPKMSGELLQQRVEKNQFVEQGTTLAVIDHESLEIHLKMEQYSIEQALDQYKSLYTTDSNQNQLDQALRS